MTLLNKAQMRTLKLQMGPGFGEMAFRRTGRSTAQALRFLAYAMESPGSLVNVRDHHGTPESDRYLMQTIADMIEKLGLSHFEFGKRDRTLKFTWVNPFREVDNETKQSSRESQDE